MRFIALFIGLVFALPALVLSAVIPKDTIINVQARGLDGDARGYKSLLLKTRQLPLIPIAGVIVSIIDKIVGRVHEDNLGRSEFTQEVVTESYKSWPQFNWVICHSDHTQRFDGVQGENWDHFHREYDILIGSTVGYEIYWFESGTFERHGDGGFENWAYIGDVVSTSDDGATVVFS